MRTRNSTKEYGSVAFLFIATGSYLNLCKKAIISLDKNMINPKRRKIRIHIFTNNPSFFSSLQRLINQDIKIITHKIENLKWPEATLLRFQIFCEFEKAISENLIIYLDSDMLSISKFSIETLMPGNHNRILFTPHPGYFLHGKLINKVKLILGQKRFRKSLIVSLLSATNKFGAWETNKDSQAYVSRKKRKIYVHGALFSGYRNTFFSMCDLLKTRITLDLSRKYIAKWHDESHLNWYLSNFGGEIASSRFSAYEPYADTMKLNPIFITVQKSTALTNR